MQYSKLCSTFHGPWFALKVEATSCLLLEPWKVNLCVKFLNGVLGARQIGGLHVTATVCDIFSLLYMLIDAHLSPTAQSTMKVSLAEQMMDHTAKASLNAASFLGKEDSTAFIVLYYKVK